MLEFTIWNAKTATLIAFVSVGSWSQLAAYIIAYWTIVLTASLKSRASYHREESRVTQLLKQKLANGCWLLMSWHTTSWKGIAKQQAFHWHSGDCLLACMPLANANRIIISQVWVGLHFDWMTIFHNNFTVKDKLKADPRRKHSGEPREPCRCLVGHLPESFPK
jgi:hypothetical protein